MAHEKCKLPKLLTCYCQDWRSMKIANMQNVIILFVWNTMLQLFAVYKSNCGSRILPVIHNIITSSYLDKSFRNDTWEIENIVTVKNDYLERAYRFLHNFI